ncbi:ATP-binding cassette domain-containing protein [Microbacterium stercoris]|uniref:ATP-binding cassette domain-containing protein n=1 Tax=Microbacterium stercoris TaxID=2820289 RepID=A0A939QGW1_9MICO|nr:ATP-binding cassette domain-containing protein [Microbacterium stercoris]MBO3662553.1 ATP-binding cassette domain-containing protein [Microbacterium stercoris]
MAEGKVLEFRGVTKVFGDVAAVSDFTARIEPGVVTGFVGPNGAGKSTTLRILLGDIAPTKGTALIDGVVYKKLQNPRRTVGALLENQSYKPRHTAVRHLTLAARAIGVPVSRVDEMLEVVGLGGVGGMRIGGYSLGMRQRLGVAEALLGDPDVLVFDEPANGLDPEGIRWMRLLMRRLADEGRTVLMSSHVLSEVQQVADNILIISNGRLLFSGGIEQLADAEHVVAVDSPQRGALRDLLRDNGYEFELLRSGVNVLGARPSEIGQLAAQAGVPLSSLAFRQPSLEDVFLKIVNGTWAGPASAAAGDEATEPEAGSIPTPVSNPAAVTPPMPAAVVAPVAAPAAAVAVDPFVPGAADPVTPAAGPGSAHDPLAWLDRPASEIEKDVEAREAELIAASPEGEQPTPGWVPAPEVVPSPAEEDADDPDALETADATIELPESEAGGAEYADGGQTVAIVGAGAPEHDGAGAPEVDTASGPEVGGLSPVELERQVEADEAELIAASPEGEQPSPGWVPEPEPVPSPAEEDADDPDTLETPDEVVDLDDDGESGRTESPDPLPEDAGGDADVSETPDRIVEIDDEDRPTEAAFTDPIEGEISEDERAADEVEEVDPIDNAAHDDADQPDELETPDEEIVVAPEAAEDVEPAQHRTPTWPGLSEWKHSREG